MNRERIEESVKNLVYLAKSFHGIEREDYDLNTSLESAGLDSLDCVELVMAIEEDFEIEIEDAEMYNVHTIRDVVELIKRKL